MNEAIQIAQQRVNKPADKNRNLYNKNFMEMT